MEEFIVCWEGLKFVLVLFWGGKGRGGWRGYVWFEVLEFETIDGWGRDLGGGGVLKVWYNGLKRGSGYKLWERICKFVFFF